MLLTPSVWKFLFIRKSYIANIKRIIKKTLSKVEFICYSVLNLLCFSFVLPIFKNLLLLKYSLLKHASLIGIISLVFYITSFIIILLSINVIYKKAKKKWSTNFTNRFILLTTIISGFCLYFSRFSLFYPEFHLSINKDTHTLFEIKDWLIALGLGTFIWILFLLFKDAFKTKTEIKNLFESF